MKLSIHLALVTVIAATSSLPAFAGEGRGARFDFAPNHWKVEESRLPVDNYVEPAHSVRQGSVPKNLLGLDPTMLAKPVQQTPMPNPTVAARMVSPAITPQFLPKG